MSAKFVLSPSAKLDLLSIWDYISSEDSEAAADRVLARIRTEFQKLADMPGMGHFRIDLLDTRHRFWRVWSYLIVYRCDLTPIQITAVVHGARDLSAFFFERGVE